MNLATPSCSCGRRDQCRQSYYKEPINYSCAHAHTASRQNGRHSEASVKEKTVLSLYVASIKLISNVERIINLMHIAAVLAGGCI